MSKDIYRIQTMRQKRLALKRLVVSTAFRLCLVGVLLLFTVLYVTQISSISTKGYDMNERQESITELKRENQKLEFAIAQHRSLQSIQARLGTLDLVAADNVEYATLVGTAMARR